MPETQPKTGNGICAPFPVDVFSSVTHFFKGCVSGPYPSRPKPENMKKQIKETLLVECMKALATTCLP